MLRNFRFLSAEYFSVRTGIKNFRRNVKANVIWTCLKSKLTEIISMKIFITCLVDFGKTYEEKIGKHFRKITAAPTDVHVLYGLQQAFFIERDLRSIRDT
jgi:hypothetical protein